MRLYISADIEGIAGVVSPQNTGPAGFEFERARDWMTDAVLAACAVARELGAEEVVVSDSHGSGQNIRYERMPSWVQLVRSWPRPLGMMQGIESGDYAGALLIGYHAGATNPGGVLSHTMSGDFHSVALNGRVLPEAGISAAIAGHFGVPVLMVASDDVGVAETTALLGDISAATLKTSFGSRCAINPSLEEVERRLKEAVRGALTRPVRRAPFVIDGPIDVDIHLRTRLLAEWLGYINSVERLDAFTVRYRAADIIDVSRFLMFLTSARGALA